MASSCTNINMETDDIVIVSDDEDEITNNVEKNTDQITFNKIILSTHTDDIYQDITVRSLSTDKKKDFEDTRFKTVNAKEIFHCIKKNISNQTAPKTKEPSTFTFENPSTSACTDEMSPDINMTLSHTDKIPVDTNITWAHCDKITLDTNMTLSNKNKILVDTDKTLSHTDKILSDSNMPLAHINEMPPPPYTNTTLAGTDGIPLVRNMVLACLNNNRETPLPFDLRLFSNSTYKDTKDYKSSQFLTDIAKLYFVGNTAEVNDKINQLNSKIYLNIFKQICTDDIFKTELVSVKMEILMVNSIKCILWKYKKYYLRDTKDWTSVFYNLILYLQVNVKHVVEVVKRIININGYSETLKPSRNRKQFMKKNDYIQLSSPYEDLKTISYESYNDIVILNNQRAHKTNLIKTNTILNILHWPNIKITIEFPKFEVIRYTVSHSKFKLVKQGTDFKQNFETFDTSLRFKKPSFETFFYRSRILKVYLTHVIKSIENYSTCFPSWKLVMLDVLRQFMKDFNRCTNEIYILTEYYAPLTSHSYIRYLPNKLTHSLDKNKSQRLDLCLQEQLTPVLMFQVKKFDVKFKTMGENYQFEPFQIVTSLMKSDFLKFECTTCDLSFSGYFAYFELTCHLANDHGSETDWTCVLCNKEFSVKNLSDNIWQHQCLKHK